MSENPTTTTIFEVKIIPPLSTAAQLVERTTLLSLLERTNQLTLSLVVAPAGSGKTSLVASFVRTLVAKAVPVAWYSLDNSDRDFYQFCSYLLAAVRHTLGPQFGKSEAGYSLEALLTNAAPNLSKERVTLPLIERVAVTFIQDLQLSVSTLTVINRRQGAESGLAATTQTQTQTLAGVTTGLWLVLDDYQFADNPNATSFLQQLIRLLPEGLLHLIISTRQLPADLPFAELLAHSQAQIIGANQLIFTPAEVALLVRRQFPGIKEEQEPEQAELQSLTERLYELSGGWAVALNLTLLNLSNYALIPNPNSAYSPVAASAVHRVRDLLENWLAEIDLSAAQPVATNNRILVNQPVFNYLASALFREQSEERQEFLLRSCVLPSVNEEWCSYLTGFTLEQTRHILAELEAQQFFVNHLTTTPSTNGPGTATLANYSKDGGVYQYHNLIRLFLQLQLTTRPALFTEVYLRSANLCAELGQFEAAVGFYLKAGHGQGQKGHEDGENKAIELLTTQALPLYEAGKLHILNQLLRQFPARLLEKETAKNPALLRTRALLCQEQNLLREAQAFFRQATTVYRQNGQSTLANLTQAEESLVLFSIGEYTEAKAKALAVIAACLANAREREIGAFGEDGENEKGKEGGRDDGKNETALLTAFITFSQRLSKLKPGADAGRAGMPHQRQKKTGLGASYVDGQWEEEEETLLRTLGIAGIGVGAATVRLGQFETAEGWFSGSERIYESQQDLYRLNLTWLNYSLMFITTGKLLRAKRLFEKTGPYWKRTGNVGREAYIEYFKGSIERRAGHYEVAIPRLQACVQQLRELGNGYLEPFALQSLGESLRELGRYKEAEQVLETALEQVRDTQKELEIELEIGLGLTHWLAGNRPLAREFYEETETLIGKYGLVDKGALVDLAWAVSEVDTRAYTTVLGRLKDVLKKMGALLTPPVKARLFFLMAIASFGYYYRVKSNPDEGKGAGAGQGVVVEKEAELLAIGSSDFLGYLLIALEISDTFHYDPYLGCELTRASDLLSYVEIYRPRLLTHHVEKNSVLLEERLVLAGNINGEGKGRKEETEGVTPEEEMDELLNLLSEFVSRHNTLVVPISHTTQAKAAATVVTTTSSLADKAKAAGSRSRPDAGPVATTNNQPAYLLELRALDGQYGRVFKEGVEIINWEWSKARTLLFFLVEHPNSSMGKILTALWSLTSEVKPVTVYWLIAGLRKTLNPVATISKKSYRVELLGQATLEAGPANSPAWEQTLIYYDAAHFEQAVKKLLENQASPNSQDVEKVLSLYQGEYLGAVNEGWAEERRRELGDLYLEGRTLLANLYQQTQNYRAAIESWREVLRLDPYYEEAHQGIIESYDALGQHKEARQQQMTYDQAMRELESH